MSLATLPGPDVRAGLHPRHPARPHLFRNSDSTPASTDRAAEWRSCRPVERQRHGETEQFEFKSSKCSEQPRQAIVGSWQSIGLKSALRRLDATDYCQGRICASRIFLLNLPYVIRLSASWTRSLTVCTVERTSGAIRQRIL